MALPPVNDAPSNTFFAHRKNSIQQGLWFEQLGATNRYQPSASEWQPMATPADAPVWFDVIERVRPGGPIDIPLPPFSQDIPHYLHTWAVLNNGELVTAVSAVNNADRQRPAPRVSAGVDGPIRTPPVSPSTSLDRLQTVAEGQLTNPSTVHLSLAEDDVLVWDPGPLAPAVGLASTLTRVPVKTAVPWSAAIVGMMSEFPELFSQVMATRPHANDKNDFGQSVTTRVAWLISQQNLDGGFPFWPGRQSDVFATSVALKALNAAQRWLSNHEDSKGIQELSKVRSTALPFGPVMEGALTYLRNVRPGQESGFFESPARALATWAAATVNPNGRALPPPPQSRVPSDNVATKALYLLTHQLTSTAGGLSVMSLVDEVAAGALNRPPGPGDALTLLALLNLRPEAPRCRSSPAGSPSFRQVRLPTEPPWAGGGN